MNDPLAHAGQAEPFKFWWHFAIGVLTGAAAGYNAMAFSERREPHLFVNAIVYLGITVWESRHMARHLDALQQGR